MKVHIKYSRRELPENAYRCIVSSTYTDKGEIVTYHGCFSRDNYIPYFIYLTIFSDHIIELCKIYNIPIDPKMPYDKIITAKSIDDLNDAIKSNMCTYRQHLKDLEDRDTYIECISMIQGLCNEYVSFMCIEGDEVDTTVYLYRTSSNYLKISRYEDTKRVGDILKITPELIENIPTEYLIVIPGHSHNIKITPLFVSCEHVILTEKYKRRLNMILDNKIGETYRL